MGSLFSRLRAAGCRQGWWGQPEMLVAISGGGDSVALAGLLRRYWRGRQVWAHLDHGIREESSRDALFVSELASQWGIPCVVERVSLPALRERGESLEMAARRVRYGFLERTAEDASLALIALAHTADDQAETLLLHLARGTGIWGLAGMPERRGNWVRPLATFRREELRSFLLEEGISWVEDLSNQDRTFLRNRVRHDLIPWFETHLNPAFSLRAQALAAEARQVRERLAREAEQCLRWLAREAFPVLACWDRRSASSLSLPLRMEALRLQGRILGLPTLECRRCEELAQRIGQPGRFRFPWRGRVEVCASTELLGFRVGGDKAEESLRLPLPDEGVRVVYRWGCWEVGIQTKKSQGLLPWGERSGWLGCSGEDLTIVPMGEDESSSIPWWARRAYPSVRCGEERWYPGMDVSKRGIPGGCAMIARVSIRPILSREVDPCAP